LKAAAAKRLELAHTPRRQPRAQDAEAADAKGDELNE